MELTIVDNLRLLRVGGVGGGIIRTICRVKLANRVSSDVLRETFKLLSRLIIFF